MLDRFAIYLRNPDASIRATRLYQNWRFKLLRSCSLITKKTIEVEVKFYGSGVVEKVGEGAFVGGVPAPKVGNEVGFSIYRQVVDDNGILNPVLGEDSVQGSFQINLFSTTKGYRELGKYLIALAELDTRCDSDFHEHHDHLHSVDGRSHLHVIVRKQKKSRAAKA